MILHIEHEVGDFDTWKQTAFDSDPLDRERMGVRRYLVARSMTNRNFVLVDLEFDSLEDAEAMHAALRRLWQAPLARIGEPKAQIVEIVEVKELQQPQV
ncbi:MAG TPA: hypothetical protein VF160_01185 [Candidatus Dormibacteraeota bacterium]